MQNKSKQIILVRRDLQLKRAVMCALVAKASAEFFVANDDSTKDDELLVKLTPAEAEWITNGSTRIVLGVPSESVLRSILFKAEIEGLQYYSVEGRIGNWDEDSQHELLAASIGPDENDKLDEITKGLKLL